jgi:hypothetical protein
MGTDQQTIGPTDQWTDEVSHRDAMLAPEKIKAGLMVPKSLKQNKGTKRMKAEKL